MKRRRSKYLILSWSYIMTIILDNKFLIKMTSKMDQIRVTVSYHKNFSNPNDSNINQVQKITYFT